MNFLSIANNRYTAKTYDSTKKVTDEKIEQLKEILRLSPSSINSQPWKFTFISDDKLKNQLAEASFFNEHKVKDASHLIVFSALTDVSQFEAQIQKYLPEGNVGYYNQMLKPQGEDAVRSWIEKQVYLSLGFFLSAVASMDIDSTPMEGIDTEKYAQILKADAYKPLFAVTIGYRDPQDSNQPSVTQKSRLDKVDIIESI